MVLNRSFVHALAPAFALGLAMSSLTACPGPPANADCEDYQGLLDEELENRGALQPFVPEVPPYPMALVLGETAINELLANLTDSGETPDFSTAVSTGPFLISFAAGQTELTLEAHGECGTCIKVDLSKVDLGLSFGGTEPPNPDVPEPIFTGSITAAGDVSFGLPIRVERYNEVSYLVADFNALVLRDEDVKLTLYSQQVEEDGIPLDDFKGIKDYLRETIQDQLADSFGTSDLLEMRPWSLGGENVVLAAREVFVNPEENTLVIGAATNLDMPANAGLDTQVSIADGQFMAVRFHVELIEKMCQRMIEEGEIPRNYDDNGNPNPDGVITVTLDSMTTSANNNARLDTEFRVWRTDDQYCGFANVEMPMFMELENELLGVRAGDISVPGGEGIGVYAASDPEFVEKNQGVVDEFKTALAEQVGLTVDYRAIDSPKGVINLRTNGVVSIPEGIEVSLQNKQQ